MMKKFPRLIAAMVTPFKEDYSVDYDGAQKLALHLLEAGNDGLVISGTTGEAPTLSVREKIDLFKAIKEAVRGKGMLFAGTGTNSTADCIHLTEEAEKIGVDGLLVVTPYYNKPNQEGLYRHFEAVAQTTSLPVILYNVPGRTGTNLLPETVLKLSAIPNIVALKEAAGNLDQVSQAKMILPPDFLVYSGDDGLTLPMLAVGCYGVISVASHIVAGMMKEMIECFLAGKNSEAEKLHLKMFPLFKNLFITANPIPIKKALEILGLPSGKLRLPLVEASPAETAIIIDSMRKAGLAV